MELKIILEALSKREKNQKTELSEASDLRKESIRSGVYDGFDELADLNNFANKMEMKIRKKQQKVDSLENEADRLKRIAKNENNKKDLNDIEFVEKQIKLIRSNFKKVLQIVQDATRRG